MRYGRLLDTASHKYIRHLLEASSPTHHYSVKDHPPIKNGYKACLWCSQDVARKKRSKATNDQDIKNHDTTGMHRYDCNSCLVVPCRKSGNGSLTISVNLRHHEDHVPFPSHSESDTEMDEIINEEV